MKRYDGRTKPIPKPRPLPVKGKKGKKLVRVTLKFIIIHDMMINFICTLV